MRLYDIADDYQSALDGAVDVETGEINEQYLSLLDSLGEDLKEKGLAVAYYIKNIDADRDAIKAEKDRLAKKEKAIANKINWLHEYLTRNMDRCGISKIECPYFSIKLKDCPPSVDIHDEQQIPDEYIKRKEVVSFDKAKMNVDLKNGKHIPGADLKRNKRIDIK